jgi:LuxR family maltose regulon positive regulatory protein
VLGWLNTLPEALLRTRPRLCVYYAFILTVTNQLETAEVRLQEAERGVQQLPAEQAQAVLGWVLNNRGAIALFYGDIPQAVSLARRVLELLPEVEVIPRMGALATTIRSYLVSGDVTSASEREVSAVAMLIHTSENPYAAVNSICLLARLRVLQGRLRQAATTYEQVVQAIPRPEVLQTAFSSLFYYFGLGDLLREWNELEAAEQHLLQGMALVKETLTVEPFVAMLGYTALARLQQARGNILTARATLDALARLAARATWQQPSAGRMPVASLPPMTTCAFLVRASTWSWHGCALPRHATSMWLRSSRMCCIC